MLSDTHCHLFFDAFHEDFNEILERAWESGIDRILVPGIDIRSSLDAITLAETYENIFAAVGIHPNSASEWGSHQIKCLEELCTHPKVVAIGEIGLDYYHDRTPVSVQKAALKDQLDLAADTSLPVILHCRRSFPDLIDIIQAYVDALPACSTHKDHPGVFHSFEGTIEQSDEVINARFMIGVSGVVTYPKSDNLQHVVSDLSLQNTVVETDAPFLSPQPFRGKRNEPAFIESTVNKIAEICNLTPNDVAKVTSENANKIFNWRKTQ